MRRLSGLLLAGALMMLPVFSQPHMRAAEQAAQKLTFDGDTALWQVAIKPDKTADFEKLMGKVKEALTKSDKAEPIDLTNVTLPSSDNTEPADV